jgi:hypothetical protein
MYNIKIEANELITEPINTKLTNTCVCTLLPKGVPMAEKKVENNETMMFQKSSLDVNVSWKYQGN